jgi:hypothetical protein
MSDGMRGRRINVRIGPFNVCLLEFDPVVSHWSKQISLALRIAEYFGRREGGKSVDI